jgi:hypothetical protein
VAVILLSKKSVTPRHTERGRDDLVAFDDQYEDDFDEPAQKRAISAEVRPAPAPYQEPRRSVNLGRTESVAATRAGTNGADAGTPRSAPPTTVEGKALRLAHRDSHGDDDQATDDELDQEESARSSKSLSDTADRVERRRRRRRRANLAAEAVQDAVRFDDDRTGE